MRLRHGSEFFKPVSTDSLTNIAGKGTIRTAVVKALWLLDQKHSGCTVYIRRYFECRVDDFSLARLHKNFLTSAFMVVDATGYTLRFTGCARYCGVIFYISCGQDVILTCDGSADVFLVCAVAHQRETTFVFGG